MSSKARRGVLWGVLVLLLCASVAHSVRSEIIARSCRKRLEDLEVAVGVGPAQRGLRPNLRKTTLLWKCEDLSRRVEYLEPRLQQLAEVNAEIVSVVRAGPRAHLLVPPGPADAEPSGRSQDDRPPTPDSRNAD